MIKRLTDQIFYYVIKHIEIPSLKNESTQKS